MRHPIAAALALSLTACGGSDSTSVPASPDDSAQSQINPQLQDSEPDLQADSSEQSDPNDEATYLRESVNYYCSSDGSSDGWIWNFSAGNELRDSQNIIVGNWAWTTNTTITVSPSGNVSTDVVDQTDRLGLFNVNNNTRWGACTVATAEQIEQANRPIATLADGTTQQSTGWPQQELAGRSIECTLVNYNERDGWHTRPNTGTSWYFFTDGTGVYDQYRLLVDGAFTWTKNSDSEYALEYAELPSLNGVHEFTDASNNFVKIDWYSEERYIQVPDSGEVSAGYACFVR